MSLVRIAVRHCLVAALKGRTLVGDNVLDSRIGALDVDADGGLRTVEDREFLAVYTDGARVAAGEETLRGLTGNGAIDILFETGITTAMTEKDDETGEHTLTGIAIPATDAAFEFKLDMVIRQVATVLTDPENDWADLFNSFCTRFGAIERARTSNDRDGVRLAGQQLKIAAELIDDPLAGEPIDPAAPFGRFLAKLEASEDPFDRARAALMRGSVEGASADWQAFQRSAGMTDGELLSLGLGPVANDDDRSTPELDEATIAMDGTAGATVTNG